MKIGIFGGCFNPPHNMHKNISLELINNGYLDKIIYVPTGDKYNKRDLIDFKHRLNMLKLMIEDNEDLLLSDIGNDDRYQSTYQTLDYFKNIYVSDDIYFICGSDNLDEFDTWVEYQYILKNYCLLVIKRNNDNICDILSKYSDYLDNIVISNVNENDISSTSIRNDIDGSCEYLDKNVYDYIKRNKIYVKKIG